MNFRILRGWWVLSGMVWLTGVLTGMPVIAQESPVEPQVQFKTGISGWVLGKGQTTWNHDVSRLTYKDTGTNIIEFSGQATFAKRWFVRANYGYGAIGGGQLIDDDFINPNGPVNSRTSSDINGNNTWYVNGDVGTTVVRFPNQRGTLSIFTGIQYWRQEYQAVGVTQIICNPNPIIPCNPANNGRDLAPGEDAIKNTTTWTSLKLGIESEYRFTRRFSIEGRAAFIPFTHLSNDDVHQLRTMAVGGLPALQQNPSFKMTGNGIGADLEANLNYMILPRLVASLGYRFWWNQVKNGTFTAYPVGFAPTSVNLNEFQTYRYGMTLGLSYVF